ncbi:MAG: helicase HerA-like domain-containing protein, partial [Pseudomonadota bacterium]
FRPNPAFDTQDAIRDVGVGEAVVSLLENKGVPSVVERTLIRPPSSQLGPIDDATRKAVIASSPIAGLYETATDRESAYELLSQRAEAAAAEAARIEEEEERKEEQEREFQKARRYERSTSSTRSTRTFSTRARKDDTITDTLVKAAIRTATTRNGQRMIRGILGGLFKGR